MIANEPANTAWSYGRTLEINKNASWLGKEVYIKTFRLPEMKNWLKNKRDTVRSKDSKRQAVPAAKLSILYTDTKHSPPRPAKHHESNSLVLVTLSPSGPQAHTP